MIFFGLDIAPQEKSLKSRPTEKFSRQLFFFDKRKTAF
jgi:hypothetical protein